MQWVEGERLDHYIERHLRSPSVLLVLAAQWIEMVKALQQASIAHGDLQHGNVLVVQGNLKLIDYDGMFVPRLHGRVSHEVGHRNYQHPLRAASDFGPHLDNFSVWVVYMSLIVLSVAPELWTRFRGGDECLLFRRQDFERPNNSDILRALERFRDERIQSATTLFKSLLYLEPQQVPLLDGQLTTLPSPPEMALPIWLKDYVKPKLGEVASVGKPMVPEPSSTVVDPSWIFDFLGTGDSPRPSVLFKNSAVIERVLLAVSVIIGASLVIFISPAGSELNIVGLLSVVLMNLVLWVYRYRSEPALAELFTMQFEVYPIVKTKISMA